MAECICEECGEDFEGEDGFDTYCCECWEYLNEGLDEDRRENPEPRCTETEDLFGVDPA